jgi:hypothetical protein
MGVFRRDFTIMLGEYWVYILAGIISISILCWNSETRATVKASPSCSVWRRPVALTSAARVSHHPMSITVVIMAPCNLQKLQNNDLFPVAYSNVIILYRGIVACKTP